MKEYIRTVKATQYFKGVEIPGAIQDASGNWFLFRKGYKALLSLGDYVFEDGTIMGKDAFEADFSLLEKKKVAKKVAKKKVVKKKAIKK